MAGDPIPCCYDATCITLTDTTSSTSSPTYYIHTSYISRRAYARKPKRSKKMKIQERAKKMHKQSFVSLSEIKPNVFKVMGYPFKNKPEPYHKNYALR